LDNEKHPNFGKGRDENLAVLEAAAAKLHGKDNALGSLLKTRGSTHGDWIAQSATSESLYATLMSRNPDLSSSQVQAIHMICTKLSRIVCGNPDEPDHWRDIAGYATLAMNAIPTGGSAG
jgi:Domain of unknown function (DUF6378)